MDLLNRKEIADGVFLSSVTDPRFKQNRVSVCFLTQLNEDTASVNAVVPKILTNSCRKYPDLRELNAKLSSLYAARLSAHVGSIGDTQYVELSIKTIDDRYALDLEGSGREEVTGEGLSILLSCLFEPVVVDGGFEPGVTETEKQSCIDQIESELNDKRVYAVRQATRLLCKGEPAAAFEHGTVEGVSAVTPQSAYQAYQRLLKTARIEIICVGCNNFYTTRETLVEAFGNMEREPMEDCHSEPSPVKPEVLTHFETMDVNQSKLVLGFKVGDALGAGAASGTPTGTPTIDDFNALSLMVKIYGGSATSKLFDNVREKLSLCYYCWAKLQVSKRIILAECGVEKDNIEKAKAEILNQLQLLKQSDFSDEDVNHALLSLQNDLKLVNDSLSGIKTWYLNHIYRCDIISPEDAIERFARVASDRTRLVKAAQSIVLDTVYVLTEEGAQHD